MRDGRIAFVAATNETEEDVPLISATRLASIPKEIGWSTGEVLSFFVTAARHVPLGRVATSMVRLEERLGTYELTPAVAARDSRTRG